MSKQLPPRPKAAPWSTTVALADAEIEAVLDEVLADYPRPSVAEDSEEDEIAAARAAQRAAEIAGDRSADSAQSVPRPQSGQQPTTVKPMTRRPVPALKPPPLPDAAGPGARADVDLPRARTRPTAPASPRIEPPSGDGADWAALRTDRPLALSGWRRWLHVASAGTVNVGPNPRDVRNRDLDRCIQTSIHGDFSIAVVQLKGGSAKTTTASGIGNAFATTRTDPVLAVDVNPDRGNLARRNHTSGPTTDVFTLLSAPRPRRVQEFRTHTSRTSSGLDILASTSAPAASAAFSAAHFDQVWDIAKDYYSLLIADCGTGIAHESTQAALASAAAVVIPFDAKVDSATDAAATVDYLRSAYATDPETGEALLDEAGKRRWLYRHLLPRTVVVMSRQRPASRRDKFNSREALEWFSHQVRTVHEIPYDTHLDEGGVVDPDWLAPATRQAYRELAAKLAEIFPGG